MVMDVYSNLPFLEGRVNINKNIPSKIFNELIGLYNNFPLDLPEKIN